MACISCTGCANEASGCACWRRARGPVGCGNRTVTRAPGLIRTSRTMSCRSRRSGATGFGPSGSPGGRSSSDTSATSSDVLDLARDIRFDTRVVSARFDEERDLWAMTTSASTNRAGAVLHLVHRVRVEAVHARHRRAGDLRRRMPSQRAVAAGRARISPAGASESWAQGPVACRSCRRRPRTPRS